MSIGIVISYLGHSLWAKDIALIIQKAAESAGARVYFDSDLAEETRLIEQGKLDVRLFVAPFYAEGFFVQFCADVDVSIPPVKNKAWKHDMADKYKGRCSKREMNGKVKRVLWVHADELCDTHKRDLQLLLDFFNGGDMKQGGPTDKQQAEKLGKCLVEVAKLVV